MVLQSPWSQEPLSPLWRTFTTSSPSGSGVTARVPVAQSGIDASGGVILGTTQLTQGCNAQA